MFKSCILQYSRIRFETVSLEFFSKKYSSFSCSTQKLLCKKALRYVTSRQFKKNRLPSLRNKSPNSIAPESELVYGIPNSSQLIKPFCFTVAFTCGCFASASIWQYEAMRSRALTLFHQKTDWWLNRPKGGHYRQMLNRYWNSLSDGQKVASGIILINSLVCLAWQIKSFHPILTKYFLSSPSSKAPCLSMVLSTFSHSSPLHLLVNMYVLYSFSFGIGQALGKEQFLATYFSAGVVSSFASYLHKVVMAKPSVSLGASGAIMAVLAMVCTEYPDSRLAIMFLPFFSFSAGAAIQGVIALDAVGILLKWRLFDHAAHLGGALSGILYMSYGREYIWNKRDNMVKKWHEFRQPSKK